MSVSKLYKLIKNIKKWFPDNYSSSKIIKRELNYRLVGSLTNIDEKAENIMEKDWDNLILLDACRYDTFKELSDLSGELNKYLSRGSHTVEFLNKTFTETYPDTVIVTASPQFAGWEEHFYRIEHVWKDGWNNEYNTVLPTTMNERAIKASKRFPNKRLIIHYMQPHYPFIGSTGQQIKQGSFNAKIDNRESASVWELLYGNDLDVKTAKRAYKENLEIVLKHVKKLLPDLQGKTVVTSDHGNLFGKQVCFLPIKIYGHPLGIEDKELRSVPWLEIPHDTRKTIKTGSKVKENTQNHQNDLVEDRLQDLGYF